MRPACPASMPKMKNSATAGNRPRKYPTRCTECGKAALRPVVIHREVKKNHDGRVYLLAINDLPVTRCGDCGEVFFTADSDDRVNAELREHLALLSPEQIRANLQSLGITQKDAAERLGVAPETLSRWLSGAMIQSRAMDNLMRSFFACAEVRDNLSGSGANRRFGEVVRLKR